jgi:shikimate dehydrogenase
MAEHRRAAVLGSPIAHSLSPALHRAAYASLGLDWTYEAIDVTESQLPAFVEDLDATWAGLSLTMPLKECVIPLLVDVSDQARVIASVNTVLPAGGGWRGDNTDIYGITQALTAAGLAQAPATATVLGAGATARSALAALARLGVQQVTMCARRPGNAVEASLVGTRLGLRMQTAGIEPEPALAGADIVISTLPGDAATPWAIVAPLATGALLDSSYHPWPSALAAAWGGPVVASGREMLLWQAVEQVRLMTGREPSVEAMRAALPA